MTTPEQRQRAHAAQALASLTDEHPAWIALRELLATAVETGTASVSDFRLADSERAWWAGYLAGVRDILTTVTDLRAEGMAAAEAPE